MEILKLLEYYGGEVKTAAAIGVSQQTIRNWTANKKVPDFMQLAIQTLTNGKLKADKSCFK